MTTSIPAPLERLVAVLRAEAHAMRVRHFDERLGAVYLRLADEVEQAAAESMREELTLEQAAALGGYSVSHLRALVARGELTNVGRAGAVRVRRCDVPTKGAGPEAPPSLRPRAHPGTPGDIEAAVSRAVRRNLGS